MLEPPRTIPAHLADLQYALGIGDRQIQKLRKEYNLDGSSIIVQIKRGEYDLLQSVCGYLTYQRDTIERKTKTDDNGDTINPAVETALLKRTQRFKLELEIEEERKRLVDVNDVRTSWLEIISLLNSFIDALPGRLSGELASELDVDTAHIYDILLGESIQIRESIAKRLTAIGHHSGDGESSQTTP